MPRFRFAQLEHATHLFHGQAIVKETADLLERKELRRGALRLDRNTLVSLGFVAAATLSPRALRLTVQAWMQARNLAGRLLLCGRSPVEWRTRKTAAQKTAGAAAPAPGRAPTP